MLELDLSVCWMTFNTSTPHAHRPERKMGNPRELQQSNSQTSTTLPNSNPTHTSGSRIGISNNGPPAYDTLEGISPQRESGPSSWPELGSPRLQPQRSNEGVLRTERDSTQHWLRVLDDSVSNADARNRIREEEIRRRRRSTWPHNASSLFACLCCVLGMYNISRFSVLVYIYKGIFILQFLVLSLVLGVPFLYLQMALGQYLGSGILEMWYISPAFKGIGVALLYTYIITGVYTSVPISWLIVYFKDSFITLTDSYKWARCHPRFATLRCLQAFNSSSPEYIGWTVPSYFHGSVLGRIPNVYSFGELKFEIAFNLCIVWLLVFICLSRGPKTLGKVVYILSILPLVLLLMITMRMIQPWGSGIINLFNLPWKPVLMESTSWLLAAREVFLTWGLMGAATLHLCSHNKLSTNVTKNLAIVSTTVIITLIVSSFFFACTVNVLEKWKLSLIATSYEKEMSVKVLQPASFDASYFNMTLVNLVLGESLIPEQVENLLSGYQVMRFATEVFPAALAVEGVQNISSFWAICFYSMMILFGLGQQVALWSCIIESVIAINYRIFKAWQTTVTFIVCNVAFLFGLPMTSNVGLYIIYFLDFSVGSLWWIITLYLAMFVAVLFIRGRPYGTDQLVAMIAPKQSTRAWVLPILTFLWNVVLPVAYLVLSIAFLRSSSSERIFLWMEHTENYQFWPAWSKKVALWIQLIPLLIVFGICLYQAFWHLMPHSNQTLYERVRSWCCPAFPLPSVPPVPSSHNTPIAGQGSINSAYTDDPPPKYTPPPSYSTATSRLAAKQFRRQSTSSVELSVTDESIVDIQPANTREAFDLLNTSPEGTDSCFRVA